MCSNSFFSPPWFSRRHSCECVWVIWQQQRGPQWCSWGWVSLTSQCWCQCQLQESLTVFPPGRTTSLRALMVAPHSRLDQAPVLFEKKKQKYIWGFPRSIRGLDPQTFVLIDVRRGHAWLECGNKSLLFFTVSFTVSYWSLCTVASWPESTPSWKVQSNRALGGSRLQEVQLSFILLSNWVMVQMKQSQWPQDTLQVCMCKEWTEDFENQLGHQPQLSWKYSTWTQHMNKSMIWWIRSSFSLTTPCFTSVSSAHACV